MEDESPSDKTESAVVADINQSDNNDENTLERVMCQDSDTLEFPTLEPPNITEGVVYQLNFDVDHTGKHRPQSKRIVSWKYGVPRPSRDGLSVGEHEARLVWSTHSGKWSITVDGAEIISDQTKGSVLDYKWRWNHMKGCMDNDDRESLPLRIVACRKPPNHSSKDFRCYEFLIGGKTFRELPLLGSPRQGSIVAGEFYNEEGTLDNGELNSILDIIEPGWRAAGFS